MIHKPSDYRVCISQRTDSKAFWLQSVHQSTYWFTSLQITECASVNALIHKPSDYWVCIGQCTDSEAFRLQSVHRSMHRFTSLLITECASVKAMIHKLSDYRVHQLMHWFTSLPITELKVAGDVRARGLGDFVCFLVKFDHHCHYWVSKRVNPKAPSLTVSFHEGTWLILPDECMKKTAHKQCSSSWMGKGGCNR